MVSYSCCCLGKHRKLQSQDLQNGSKRCGRKIQGEVRNTMVGGEDLANPPSLAALPTRGQRWASTVEASDGHLEVGDQPSKLGLRRGGRRGMPRIQTPKDPLLTQVGCQAMFRQEVVLQEARPGNFFDQTALKLRRFAFRRVPIPCRMWSILGLEGPPWLLCGGGKSAVTAARGFFLTSQVNCRILGRRRDLIAHLGALSGAKRPWLLQAALICQRQLEPLNTRGASEAF